MNDRGKSVVIAKARAVAENYVSEHGPGRVVGTLVCFLIQAMGRPLRHGAAGLSFAAFPEWLAAHLASPRASTLPQGSESSPRTGSAIYRTHE